MCGDVTKKKKVCCHLWWEHAYAANLLNPSNLQTCKPPVFTLIRASFHYVSYSQTCRLASVLECTQGKTDIALRFVMQSCRQTTKSFKPHVYLTHSDCIHRSHTHTHTDSYSLHGIAALLSGGFLAGSILLCYLCKMSVFTHTHIPGISSLVCNMLMFTALSIYFICLWNRVIMIVMFCWRTFWFDWNLFGSSDIFMLAQLQYLCVPKTQSLIWEECQGKSGEILCENQCRMEPNSRVVHICM